ncbi:MAG: hypothetical protein JNL53_12960 [Cyclobacteriaceae bacterium]|nr:hypothetical protein [Cyclobacteriaceae bacterium]
MTFDEAISKKSVYPDNYIEDEIEMKIIVIPENPNDQSKYWKFIMKNYSDFSNKDVLKHSSNNKFILGAIGQDEVSGNFIYQNELPDNIVSKI